MVDSVTMRHPAAIYVDVVNFLSFNSVYKVRRYSASLLGIVLSLKLFIIIILISGGVASTMILATLIATKAFVLKSKVFIAATAPFFTSILFAISMIAHEYGHLWVLRRSGKAQQSFIIGRVFTVSIAHPKLPRKLGVLVSICGPLLVLVLGFAVTLLMWLLGAPKFYYSFIVILCATHLYTLTPWSKDGQILWGIPQK